MRRKVASVIVCALTLRITGRAAIAMAAGPAEILSPFHFRPVAHCDRSRRVALRMTQF